MARLRDRVGKLEKRAAADPPPEAPSAIELLVKEVENWRRVELGGLDPSPLTPEEEALSAAGDRWFYEEYIPHLRELGGSPETLAMIDELEEHANERSSREEKTNG